jgi:toxin ParE1/3/4
MPARIRLHRAAATEADAAMRWYENACKGLGADFVEELRRVVSLVADSPHSWAVSELDGRARCARLARFPYMIIFLIHHRYGVVIVAVAHAKRRPGYWLPRTAAY